LCVHGSGEGLGINEVVVTKDGIEVGMLGQVDGVGVAITHDSDAEHPVKLAEVSDLDVVAEAVFELFNEVRGGRGDGAVVDVHSDNDELLDLRQELVEYGLIHSRLLVTQGNKD
jgi:hypothetical protein